MAIFKRPVSLLILSLFILSNIQTQNALPTVACICELEALILDSKITSEELVIEETESGYAYSFKTKELPEPQIELDEEEVEITEDEPVVRRVKSEFKQRRKGKRKKRKKVKLRKRKARKYNGKCPTWWK